jgi:hypothetical protein
VLPPFVGVAVMVTGCPLQMVVLPEVAAIATVGATVLPTVMVIPLLVAVVGLAQLELEVIIHEITLLFVREEVVNVGLSVPTFVDPFNFQ